jgi:hypothetical protein
LILGAKICLAATHLFARYAILLTSFRALEMLGKRKRASAVLHRKHLGDDTDAQIDRQDLIRKVFEARFHPLPVEPDQKTPELLEEDSGSDEFESEESTWEGFSDNRDSPPSVEVVTYNSPSTGQDNDPVSPHFKSFMVS